jgi:hypothetical protein
MNEELLNKIISVAYSDAGIKDRILVYRLSKKDKEVKAVLDEYRKTANAVHSIQEEKCPENLVKKAGLPEKENERSFFFDLFSLVLSNPVKTFAVTVTVIIIAISTLLLRKPEEAQRVYTKQEIERANAQARTTLAMVGSILNQSKRTVIKEILPEKVSKPLNDGLNYVKDFIHEEKKNENVN